MLWCWAKMESRWDQKSVEGRVARAGCVFQRQTGSTRLAIRTCADATSIHLGFDVPVAESQLSIGHGSSHDASMDRQSGPWGPASNFTPSVQSSQRPGLPLDDQCRRVPSQTFHSPRPQRKTWASEAAWYCRGQATLRCPWAHWSTAQK